MSKMIVNIAIAGAFVVIVLFLGSFLWQTLFATHKQGQAEGQTKITYGDKQASGEQLSGGGSTPHRTNPTEEAIADYTKWLAIFTLFLVLATI